MLAPQHKYRVFTRIDWPMAIPHTHKTLKPNPLLLTEGVFLIEASAVTNQSITLKVQVKIVTELIKKV